MKGVGGQTATSRITAEGPSERVKSASEGVRSESREGTNGQAAGRNKARGWLVGTVGGYLRKDEREASVRLQ